MKNESHKLDDLFKEKLSDMEIPLEEDYWPYIEQKVSVQPNSFYKFGWKHINIYNSSVLLLLIGAVCFFNIPNEQKIENNSTPTNTGIPTDKEDSTLTKDPVNKKTAPINAVPEIENKKATPITPFSGEEVLIRDSSAHVSKQEAIIPSGNQESAKVIPEEKVNPKKIIYVVQQDTIVEKDTVKVRRRRKK